MSLYESLPTDVVEEPGTKVTRTQWLDFSALGSINNLVGKRILIVDEVDDTRTTLEYAVKELEKDVEEARVKLGSKEETHFSIFVLHVSSPFPGVPKADRTSADISILQNKDKPKKGTLPKEMLEEGRYVAARTVGDEWICYPWEALDIDEHDRFAAEAAKAASQ